MVVSRIDVIIKGHDQLSPIIDKINRVTDQLSSKFKRISKDYGTFREIPTGFGNIQRSQRVLEEFLSTWEGVEKVSTRGGLFTSITSGFETVRNFVIRTGKVVDNFDKKLVNIQIQSKNTARGLKGLGKSFDLVAWRATWGALSLLGVIWSLQAVLTYTIEPLKQHVNALSDYSNSAFRVATWLAIAKREGLSFVKDVNIQEAAKNMTDTALKLKATWGSLTEAFTLFLNKVLNTEVGEGKTVLDYMNEAFEELWKFLQDSEVQEMFARFLKGVFEGIKEGIPKVKELLKWIDKTFNLERIGRWIGLLGAIMPVLAPILSGFQAFLAILQSVFFVIGNIFGGLARLFILAKLLGRLRLLSFASALTKIRNLFTKIVSLVKSVISKLRSFISLLRRIPKRPPVGNIGIIPALPAIPAFRKAGEMLFGEKNIQIYQYVSIGSIEKEADVNEVTDRLVRDLTTVV